MHPQHRPARIPCPRRLPRVAGITLVELLVVVAVGAVVLAGAVAMVVSHIRSTSQMAALLHLQDQCGRVQFLINFEIQQAQQAGGGGSTLTLDVPGMAAPIRYTLNNGELWRNGPPINALGRLENTAPVDAVVVRGVQAFAVNVANPRHPTYTLTVRDASGVTYSTNADGTNPGGAQCRVREISGAAGG